MENLRGLAFSIFLVVAATSATIPPQIQPPTGSVLHKRFEGGLGSRSAKAPIEPKYRLGDTIVPRSYDITVAPIVPINGAVPTGFTKWDTPGTVTIVVECMVPTNLITLTINNIAINESSVKVTAVDGNVAQSIQSFRPDPAQQFFNISLEQPLEQGKQYQIYIEFVSKVSPTVRGLYQARYEDPDGNVKELATSQFETVGFREFAPGFDEPRFKATFTLHVGRHPSLNSASNTPRVTGEDPTSDRFPSEYEWDHYDATPNMSSYLVALVVSDFAREGADKDILGKEVGIYGPPHLIEGKKGGVFAANASAHILKAYGELLGVNYTLEKMDSVAVPRDYFQFGAMENWGLNIYRDNLLLYFDDESPEASRNQILSILAHELGHQWFGNLITCEWWSQIFLNEGFATYMAFTAVQAINPEYDPRRVFLYDTVHTALQYDANTYSHPVINTGLREEVEAMSIFDTISYDKGASLIRMLEATLGEEDLYRGLKAYLDEMQFKPANQDDLFRNLDKFKGFSIPDNTNITSIMKTWTEQRGFPLIRVSRAYNNTIYVSQERFRNNVNGQTKELDPDDLWDVPVAIATADNPTNIKPSLWLERDTLLKSYKVDTTKWLIANPGGYGFYRTLYDAPLYKLITEQLKADHSAIDGLSKGQLISDYFTFADQRIVSYETALELTKFIGDDPDHVVWMVAISALNKIVTSAFGSGGYLDGLKAYLLPKITAPLNLIGREQPLDEHGAVTLLRPYLLNWACSMEEPACLQVADDLLNRWEADASSNPIALDIQPVIYCSALLKNSSHFDFLVERYVDSMDGRDDYNRTQASRLASALTCSEEFEHTLRILASIFGDPSDEHHFPISKAHIRTFLSGLGASSDARRHALNFVSENYELIANSTDGKLSTVAGILSDISVYQSTTEDLEEVKKIVSEIQGNVDVPDDVARSFAGTQSRIEGNIAWARDTLPGINAWLLKNA